MSASKVACPNCQAVLKSARPVPAGTKIKCPRCAVPFTVPGEGASVPGSAAIRPAAPPDGKDSKPNGQAVANQLPPAPDVSLPPRRSMALPLLVAAVLLMGTGAGALWMMGYLGAPSDGSASNQPDPEDVVVPPLTKIKPQPLITLSMEDEKKVEEATSRAVEFLKKAQQKNGSWQHEKVSGVTAMAGLTLLECRVKADDPAVQNAAKFLRDASEKITSTYELALSILFFNRLGEAGDKGLIQKLALRLVAGQSAAGGWDYQCPVLNPEEHEQLLTLLRDLRSRTDQDLAANRAELLKSLPPHLKKLAILQDTSQKKDDFFRGGGDNSNTQFGLLALWTARRHDVPLDRPLLLVARRFRATQNEDGSWSYRNRETVSPNPSMTCAGLLALAVGHGLAKEGSRTGPPLEKDEAIQKALQLVSKKIGEARKDPKAPAPPMIEMYFLWSVERAAVLYQLKAIGGKQWYQWGMDMLLSNQQADGHWLSGQGHGANSVTDTCFGLLFLQRVNLAEDLTDKLRNLTDIPVWRDEPADEK